VPNDIVTRLQELTPIDAEMEFKIRAVIEPVTQPFLLNMRGFDPGENMGTSFADAARLHSEAQLLAGPEVSKAASRAWVALQDARHDFILDSTKNTFGDGTEVSKSFTALLGAMRAEVQAREAP
jgi:hypothetical protein